MGMLNYLSEVSTIAYEAGRWPATESDGPYPRALPWAGMNPGLWLASNSLVEIDSIIAEQQHWVMTRPARLPLFQPAGDAGAFENLARNFTGTGGAVGENLFNLVEI